MRKILFRGKSKKSNGGVGGWVFGGFHRCKNSSGKAKALIVQNEFEQCNGRPYALCQEVIPSTVGQYTGLKDSVGVKIFEGDILEIRCDNILHSHLKYYRAVGWRGKLGYPAFDFSDSKRSGDVHEMTWLRAVDNALYRVVGNIYDNPELLEGGKE